MGVKYETFVLTNIIADFYISDTSNDCYLPQTESFAGKYYEGTLARTVSGSKCLNWLDRQGSTCSEFECENHNYCRHFPGMEG